jgi:hypothetical protein
MDYSTIDLSVELIDPSKASAFLRRNFGDNRKISPSNVDEWAAAMRTGTWELSSDAITFDVAGNMINGQHRLTSIVKSGTTQPFIVVRNMPIQSAQVIDLGKKRMMHERLTVAGNPISKNVCAAVRNAMTDCTSNYVGTNLYSEVRHDKLVYDTYEKHSNFWNYLEEKSLIKPSFYAAVAGKIYAEMFEKLKEYEKQRLPGFNHQMHPFDRAIQFLELANHGISSKYRTEPLYDSAAIRLKELRDAKKSQYKHWSTIQDYRLTVSAGYSFMMGKNIKTIKPYATDPFRNFISLPGTNV